MVCLQGSVLGMHLFTHLLRRLSSIRFELQSMWQCNAMHYSKEEAVHETRNNGCHLQVVWSFDIDAVNLSIDRDDL